MGGACVRSITPDEENSRKIDQELKQENQIKREKAVTILLLGPGESGKSTILKQMKILSKGHDGGGFTDEDRLMYRATIKKHVIQNMQDLIKGAGLLKLEITENKAAADRIAAFTYDENFNFTLEIISDIKVLWKNPAIQRTFNCNRDLSANGVNLPDCTEYFFNTALESVLDPNYIPSIEDVIRTRSKTISVVQQEFLYQEKTFRMIDVGGQKSERRKWLHMFADIDAFIYCVSLSEYDVFLREKSDKNRMEDAIEEFDKLCNNKNIKKMSIILFLNKEDLFKRKIKKNRFEYLFS